MARFSTQDSTAFRNFIYKIECGGKIYIGQTTNGFTRIRQHCNGAYRGEGFEDSGAEDVYEEIRRNGLYQTKITIYTEEDNYGLNKDDSDFRSFYSFFKPRNKDGVNDKIDVAEIIHIWKALYNSNGSKLVNKSMGGQGSSYASPENEEVTILTRSMDPESSLQILNMSQRSREDILKTNQLINEALFTEKWESLSSSISKYIDVLTTEEQKFIYYSWDQFVDYLQDNLIQTIVFENNKWTSEEIRKEIALFVSGRQKILSEVVRQTGMLFGDQLTEAQQDLFIKQKKRKLITAEFRDDPDEIINYILQALSNAISRQIKASFSGEGHDMRKMTEDEKKIEKALRGEIYGHAKKHKDFSLQKLKNFNIVNITKLFDFSSVHLRGNTDWLKGLPTPSAIDTTIYLKGYSLLNFAWYYDKVVKNTFTFIPQYVLRPDGIFGSVSTFGGEPNAMYSSRQIEEEQWLTNKMKNEMSNLQALVENWTQYFKDMIAVYRKEYGKPLTMGETAIRYDQEEPLYYSSDGDKYIVYHSDLYTINTLANLKYY